MVALLTPVVEVAAFEVVAALEAAGVVVTVVMDVLVAVDESADDTPAELDVLAEEFVFVPAPEAVPDAKPEEPMPVAVPEEPVLEAVFDEAVTEVATDTIALLAAEPEGVVFDKEDTNEDELDPPTMIPTKPVVIVETDVDVTRVVAVDKAVLLDNPAKPSVICVVELATGRLPFGTVDVNICVAVSTVVEVSWPGSTTTVTPCAWAVDAEMICRVVDGDAVAILVTWVSRVAVTVFAGAMLFAAVDDAMQGAETPDSKVAIAQDRTDRAL